MFPVWGCYDYMLIWTFVYKSLCRHLHIPSFFILFFWIFYFILGVSRLTVLWWFQVNSKGTYFSFCLYLIFSSFLKNRFLPGGYLLYNVVLVSAIQCSELAICIHISWLPRWQRIHLQCGRCGFNPWVRKIPQATAMPNKK